jgi:hypothetical protein
MNMSKPFLVQEPAISRFMNSNYPESFAGYDHLLLVQETLINMHESLLANIAEDDSRRTKKYILNLPAGVRCKMGYMNPLNGERLTGTLNFATTILGRELTNLDHDLECVHPTVTFLAVLDKEPRFIRRHAAVDNEFANMFNRISITGRQNRANQPTNTTSS